MDHQEYRFLDAEIGDETPVIPRCLSCEQMGTILFYIMCAGVLAGGIYLGWVIFQGV